MKSIRKLLYKALQGIHPNNRGIIKGWDESLRPTKLRIQCKSHNVQKMHVKARERFLRLSF